MNGFIYLITNKITNEKYVGQTSRDLGVRFHEHLYEKEGTSKLKQSIKEFGALNFKIELLEEVSLEQVDKKQKEWINKIKPVLNEPAKETIEEGIVIAENGIVFKSIFQMKKMLKEITSWSDIFLSSIDEKILDFSIKKVYNVCISDLDVQEDWIKTLNKRYQGKHIHCNELNLDFNSSKEMAQYLIDNNYYNGKSKKPLQDLVTGITKSTKGKPFKIDTTINLTFLQIPGSI